VAVGWCAVAPRERFPRVLRSPTVRPVDDRPAWAVVCFVVARAERRRGVAAALLDAAVAYAAAHGAAAVEGYPVDAGGRRRPSAALYTGTASMFRRAGFRELARRSPTRPIMRLDLRDGAVSGRGGRVGRAGSR
jgi:GNAT superfamily N-acetyltransferase